MEKANILACPFCSGETVKVYDMDYVAQVECEDCGARGPAESNEEISAAERQQNAIASWNTSTEKRGVATSHSLPES